MKLSWKVLWGYFTWCKWSCMPWCSWWLIGNSSEDKVNWAFILKEDVLRARTGFGFLSGTPATTSAATTGFSLGFNKPAGSATPFALPVTSTSASGLSLSSALTSTPAAGRKMFRWFGVCVGLFWKKTLW